jgi:peptide chain release factor 2
MDDLNKTSSNLNQQLEKAMLALDIKKLNERLNNLKKQAGEADFWQDTSSAQAIMQEISKIETRIEPWLKLNRSLEDIRDLINLGDNSLKSELTSQLNQAQAELKHLEDQLKFTGPYDDHDAIISVYAGAGGTDAQDWTQILFRMYSRYFEKNRWTTKLIDQSAGDEAGLKSVSLEVDGNFVYGLLKGEQGVHRLVRLSPFNADHLRQTSFAKVEVIPKITPSDQLDLDEKDLKVDVYRSGGHGGQSVNTTDSAVRITHLPTGITVAIQNERSRLQNKEMAMTILRSRLAQAKIEQHQETISELRGPNQSAEWGNQIRSYVLHPYKQVKDLRTGETSTNPEAVLDGNIEPFINAYLKYNMG